MTLPKLKLKKLDATAAQELLASGSERKRSLQPGNYEMVIKEVTSRGPTKRDDSWYAFSIKFEVAGERTVYSSVLVPTDGLTLANADGDQDKAKRDGARKVKELVDLLTALGIENPAQDLGTAITTAFGSDGTALVGKNVAAELDYMDTRIVGEGDGESREYVIKFRSGKVATDDNGEVLKFPDIDAAEVFAKDKGIYVFNGVSPKQYLAPKVKNTFGKKKTGSDSW